VSHARTSVGESGERTSSRRGGLLRETAIIVVSALVLSVLVRTFLVQAFYVPSESMENTLLPSDRIIASKISTTISGVHRGDVVVFTDPGGWLPPAPHSSGPGSYLRDAFTFIGLLPSDTGQDLVKRVIGLPGDRVQCCDAKGRIVLNGVPLDEVTYVKPGDSTDQVRFDITVPAGRVFVMGDNRANSRDSRYHLEVSNGGVPLEDIVGKVVVTVWPLSQFGTIGTPPVLSDPALDRTPAAKVKPLPGTGPPGSPPEASP
jgi:signal peptidase I